MQITLQDGMVPRIETKRLLLREVTLLDVTPMMQWWLNDPTCTKFLEIRHTPQTYERIAEYIASRLSRPENPHFGIYEQNEIVGTVTVNLCDVTHKTANISFVVGHPRVAGQGYATEAVHAVCWYLFNITGLEKITGGLYAENIGSRRVFEKNAFTLEGIKRKQCINADGERTDVLQYGLLKDEFALNASLVGDNCVTFEQIG